MSLRIAAHRPVIDPLSIRATLFSAHRRFFFNLPGSGGGGDAQTITATRILPHPQQALYKLIADVDSYSAFVPYCSHSRVTHWSPPDENGQQWPAVAELRVGWGGFDEVFTSRLRCVPGVSVEAVSGEPAVSDAKAASAVFKSLVTRWHLRPTASRGTCALTNVHLSIRYQFVNPLYAAVSAAVSGKVAGLMIEAFEKRAAQELGQDSKRS